MRPARAASASASLRTKVVLVTADFSSVEMRVAGALAQDRALYDVFASGDDPYWVVARQLHGSVHPGPA